MDEKNPRQARVFCEIGNAYLLLNMMLHKNYIAMIFTVFMFGAGRKHVNATRRFADDKVTVGTE